MRRNKTKLLSTLLALCLALAALPGTAASWDKHADCHVEGGNLYFAAVVDPDPVTANEFIWTYAVYNTDPFVTKADIPSKVDGLPVTRIDKGAFRGIGGLTSVTIPDSVTTIDVEAFIDCHNLASITIPDSVTAIGARAFSGCESLTSITIGNNVAFIGDGAFAGCSSLTSLTIPNAVTTSFIRGYYMDDTVTVFPRVYGCSSLTSITIPNGVTHIIAGTFDGCSSLTSITIPASVTKISNAAFHGCKSLTDVYYGGSQSDWEKISINFNNDLNDLFQSATIHYNSASSASAAPSAPQQTPAAANSVSVTVNGTAVQWPDAAPFIDEHGRTMVPLRAVADAIGLTVNWDANAREASFTDGGKTITFPIGSTTARTGDGQTVTMNTAAVIVNGRTYAPVRYLAEYFGFRVDWDAASRNVLIAP